MFRLCFFGTLDGVACAIHWLTLTCFYYYYYLIVVILLVCLVGGVVFGCCVVFCVVKLSVFISGRDFGGGNSFRIRFYLARNAGNYCWRVSVFF